MPLLQTERGSVTKSKKGKHCKNSKTYCVSLSVPDKKPWCYRILLLPEQNGIYTFDGKGELLLTIMSSLAQEESRSISENVAWGIRKSFSDGKVMMPYGSFLGYCKGEDGTPSIVPEEARVVEAIYRRFLEGFTPHQIAKELTAKGVPTPRNGKKWGTSTVLSILQNERYKGEAILQKSFCTDFLTKKTKKNEGELPQYHVRDSHECCPYVNTMHPPENA